MQHPGRMAPDLRYRYVQRRRSFSARDRDRKGSQMAAETTIERAMSDYLSVSRNAHLYAADEYARAEAHAWERLQAVLDGSVDSLGQLEAELETVDRGRFLGVRFGWRRQDAEHVGREARAAQACVDHVATPVPVVPRWMTKQGRPISDRSA